MIMTKYNIVMSILASLLFLSMATAPADSLVARFQEPERAARPFVWWHWMDGEVSLEGIRKDLEWMDAVGIAGFHQFDAGGVNMPKAAPFKRPYLSDSWKEAYRYAVRLADSLGMEMTVASAPGWSSTGGPWVTPEDAMKKLEWQTIDLKGGAVHVKLPALTMVTGPYQDIPLRHESKAAPSFGYDVALVAVKLPDAEKSMEELGARVSRDEDKCITVEFPRKTTILSFNLQSLPTGIRPREGDFYGPNEIQCSNNGKVWKTIARIPKSPQDFTTMNIPATKAKFFRVKGEHILDLKLFTVASLEHVEEKAGFANCYDFNRFDTPVVEKDTYPAQGDVVVLSGKMGADGVLDCVLPEGRWRIYRFGASLTGKMNHPASPNATGLEVDKLDKAAWGRYFHKYIEMYKEAAEGMLGERGITHMLVDSYEAGPATWTPSLPEEFKTRRGYDLFPWMPVLTGQIIESSARSEQFLRDWRQTIGELFTENYNRLNEIIAEYGMKGTYIESHETGRAFQGDGMDAKKNASVPMSAIWMTNSFSGSMLASAISDIRESASVAHIYGQNICAAESFTVNGDGKCAYTYYPGNIKMIADAAMASGLNRFVIHDSASQPSDDYLPGLGLFKYGQWFHRNETWAPYAKVWTDYLARSCQMMQTGRNVADILLFYGEDTNATSEYGGEYLEMLPHIPAGYNFDYASPDVIMNMVRAEDGRLVTDSGQNYRILVLGGSCKRYLSEKMNARIASFISQGVPVCYEDELAESLKLAGIKPDVEIGSASGVWDDGYVYGGKVARNHRGHDATLAGIQFVHRVCHSERSEESADIYWLCNFTGADWQGDVRFRDGGSNVAIFNPETGEAFKASGKVCLKAGDALFFVLTDKPLDIPDAVPAFKTSEILTLDRYWDVEFNQKGGEHALETFSTLNDWTSNSNPVVKYFSGTANYRSSFCVPAGSLNGLDECRLDLGNVQVMAELIINGHNAGVLWRSPYISGNILPYLKEGENTIEVNVTNLWVNRMIGDRQRGEKPVTNVRRFYNAGDKLLSSGLLGPVKLIGYSE